MHDLVIRNGTIVDGTGAAAFTGDLAAGHYPHEELPQEFTEVLLEWLRG